MKSKRGKVNRYNNRINKYQQNRTFRNNEGVFYKLNGDSNNENTNSTPDENESREFWKKNMGH